MKFTQWVKGNRIVVFSLLAALSVILVGCDNLDLLSGKAKSPSKKTGPVIPVKGPLVAKINNIPITLEDLTQEIEAYNSMVPSDRPEQKITTREQKINYLKNELVRRALLYQEALDMGLESNTDVLRALEKTKEDLLVVQLIKDETSKIDVSSKEIEEYYNTYKDQLKEPEERRVSEIVVSTEPEAKDILIQLLQGNDFSALAKERSKSATRKSGGDLGFLQKGMKFSQFDEIVFSDTLDIGQISSIFKGPEGYYIVKIEAKKGGKQRSLSEMWDDIKRGLIFLKQQQKLEELVSKASKDAKIEIYEKEIN